MAMIVPTEGSPSAWTSPKTTALISTATAGRHLAQQRAQQRAAEEQLLGERRQQHDGERQHGDLPPRRRGRRSSRRPAWRCGRRLDSSMPIGISATSWRPIPAKNHGRSENQAAAGRRICRPKSLRSEPVPLRRATIASQAMMAKFCAQMRTMRVFGLVRVVGIDHEHRRRPPRPRCPTANAAMASPIPHRTRRRAPGTADGDDPGGGGGGGGGGGRAEEAAGGRCSLPGTLPVGTRNPRPLAAVDPGKHSGLAPAPAPWTRRRAVAWGDPRRGAGPRMSRRQTDLEPGVEPDAGETRALPARPNGRPPTPPPSWRPDARPPAGRRATGPPPDAQPPSAGPPAVGRWQLAVAALGAVDRARAHRRRVHREQPRRQQLVEGRPHVLGVRQRRSTTATSRASTSTSRPARSAASSTSPVNGKTEFSSSGPKDNLPDPTARRRSRRRTSTSTTSTTGSNILGDILLWVLPLVLIIGFFVWMSRRARRARWAR